MHLHLGLGIAGLALTREGAASQDPAVGGIPPLLVVVLVQCRLARRSKEGEVAVRIGLECLEYELPDLLRSVGLLPLKLEQPLPPGFDNDLCE